MTVVLLLVKLSLEVQAHFSSEKAGFSSFVVRSLVTNHVLDRLRLNLVLLVVEPLTFVRSLKKKNQSVLF